MLRVLLPLYVAAFLLFCSSCNNLSPADKKVLLDYKAAYERDSRVIQHIRFENESIIRTADERSKDPITAEKMTIWYPKILAIKQLSEQVVMYMRKLENELSDRAGYRNYDSLGYLNTGYQQVTRLFIKEKKAIELADTLSAAVNAMLAVDEEVNAEFGKQFSNPFSREGVKQRFSHCSVVAALAILQSYSVNILLAQHKIITYCLNRTTWGCGLSMDITAVLVGQSSNIVEAGKELILTAGVGSYSSKANPKVVFNNTVKGNMENGVATYKFKAPVKPGTYSMPVRVSYIDQNGIEQDKVIQIEYTTVKRLQ